MADRIGVVCVVVVDVGSDMVVSRVGSWGLDDEDDAWAGSGKTMSSMIDSCSASARDVSAGWSRGPRAPLSPFFRIFINDAGVFGSLPVRRVGDTGGTAPDCGWRCGDRPTDPGRGVAGGGMRISSRGSGDTDSVSELSWLYGSGRLPGGGNAAPVDRDLSASSSTSATSAGGMTVLDGAFLRLWGFIAGDCRTARPPLLVALAVDFRFDGRSRDAVDPAPEYRSP